MLTKTIYRVVNVPVTLPQVLEELTAEIMRSVEQMHEGCDACIWERTAQPISASLASGDVSLFILASVQQVV